VNSGHNRLIAETLSRASAFASVSNGRYVMRSRLPKRFPAGTKYVLEARGATVHRFVEFPDGQTLELDPRRALDCRCKAQRDLAVSHRKPSKVAA
jgi:hypothetical protein